MGTQNTKQALQQSIITINHEEFKNAKIIKQGSKTFMSITLATQEKQYQKWKATLQQHLQSKRAISQYLLMPVSHSFSRQGFCGSTGFANITYEHFPYILIQEMQLRKSQQSKFQQAQLWFLLYVLSSAQVEMKRLFGVRIGDVRPDNIFLNSDGDIKISCFYSWPGELTNYGKSIELKQTYLAPQEVQKLENGEVQNLTTFQSQIFSIGMTALSTLLLKDCYFLYDLRKPKFNYGKYNLLMQEWRRNNTYSEIFKAIIKNLCSIEPQKRLTLQQLWTFLNTYERYIIKKCKFVIINAPIKIQTTIKQLRAPQITYESKFISQVGSLSHQSTISKKTSFQYSPFSPHNDAKNIQKSISPIYTKTLSPSTISAFNFDFKQNTRVISQNQVRFNYIVEQKTLNVTPQQIKKQQNKNIVTQSAVNQNSKLVQPQQNQQQKILTNNTQNQQQTSQQVQTFFSLPQSIVTEENNQSSNNGDFVYTRRVVNINTNSLLEHQDIDEDQYVEGIKRNVSQQFINRQ